MSTLTVQPLEERVATVERELQELRALMTTSSTEPHSMAWLDTVGKFKGDDLYASIMRRGAEYRESLRNTEAE